VPTVAELSAKIEIDNMVEAMAELDRFDARLKELGATEAETKVKVDTAEAMGEVDDLQLALFSLDNDDITVPVEVPIASGLADVETLRAALESLTNAVNTKVDLDTGAAQAEIENLRAQLLAIQNANVAVNMDIGAALAHIAELELALKAIPDEKVEIKVDPDGQAVRWIDRLRSSSSRASNQVNALAMFILALGPALITIGAVGAAGVGALAVGFAAAATGAGLFAGVAVSNFGGISDALTKMQSAQKAYNLAVTDKQRDAALAQIKAAYDNLSPAEQKVVDGVHALSGAWSTFATQFKPGMFAMAAQGLQFMAQQIPLLTPLMNGMMTSAQTLEARFIAAFNGPFWRSFMATMAQIAGPVMTAMVTAFGNIIKGLAGMLQAFAPFAVGFATGFQDLTAKFAAWGIQMGQSEGFKSFIKYVQEQMPAVLGFIGALWKALVAIAQAAAPIGAALLPILTGLADFISHLNTLNPNLLSFFLVLLGVGSVLVNLIGPVLNIVKMFALLTGAETAAGAAAEGASLALGWWILIIVAVVAAIVYCWTHFEGFRNVVKQVWSDIVSAAQAAWPMLVAAFHNVVAWLQSTFGPAVSAVVQFVVQEFNKFRDWWNQNSPMIIQAMQNIWTVIKVAFSAIVAVIGVALGVIVAVWNAVWPGLSSILGAVWNTIKGVISGAMEIIRGIITVICGVITGDWSAVWSGLGSILSGAWGVIWAIISGAWGVIAGLFQMLWGLISPIWNAIWGALSSVVSTAWGAVTGAISAAWNQVVAMFNAFNGVLLAIWNVIWAVIGPPVEAAFAIVSAIINGALTVIGAVFSAIWTVVSTIWNALWSAIEPPVSAALNVVQTVVSAVLTFLSNLFTSIWNAITAVTSATWNAISSAISSVISTISSVISTTLSVISSLWSNTWSTISGVASSIWEAIKGFVTRGVSSVKQFISDGVTNFLNLWKNGWDNIGKAASEGITNVMKFISELPGKILTVISDLAGKMYNAGANLLSKLGDGIRNGISNAVNAMKDAVGQLTSFLPGSPAKQGPLSGRGYTYIRGQSLIRDFAKGIDIAQPLVAAAIADVAMTTTGVSQPLPYASSSTNSSINIVVAAGAVPVTVAPGASGDDAKAALGSAGDDLADQILVALKRR